jgi:hypothetical protein
MTKVYLKIRLLNTKTILNDYFLPLIFVIFMMLLVLHSFWISRNAAKCGKTVLPHYFTKFLIKMRQNGFAAFL